MSRPLRLFIPGYWYHIYIRGQRRQPLFFSPRDRAVYLQYLDDELYRCGGALGSFCLMTNHAHLLLRQGEEPLSKIYHRAHTGYSAYFNKLRNTDGHVLQGRPGCKIILNDLYLYKVVGYIHNNPVAAGIVDNVTEYRWSSWYWFKGKQCDWIKLKSWTMPPGFENKEKSKIFDEVVNEKQFDWENGREYIGSGMEWDKLQRRKDGRDGRKYKDRRGKKSMWKIIREVTERTEFTVDDLKGRNRKRDISSLRHKAMALMYTEGYGLTEIAKFFNRTPRIVSKAYAKYKDLNK